MKSKIFLLAGIIVLITSCEKSDNGIVSQKLVQWNVLKVEGPITGLVNQVLTFDVYCPTSSGCDYVSKFVTDVSNGKTILIKAYGGTNKNTICLESATPIDIKYDFTPLEKGNYVLIFINKDASEIKYNFIVD